MNNYVDMHGWKIVARRFSAPLREGFHYYGEFQGEDHCGPSNSAEDVWREIGEIRAEMRPERSSAGGSQMPISHNGDEIERAAIIALARRLSDPADFDAETSYNGPGRYEGADDRALVVSLDIIGRHGAADDSAGSCEETGRYLQRPDRHISRSLRQSQLARGAA